MPNSRTGHFVQIHRELGPTGMHEYVEVEGRSIQVTVTAHPMYAPDGWYTMSRELTRKRAIFYAKAYRRAGFHSRVVFHGNGGERVITDEFRP